MHLTPQRDTHVRLRLGIDVAFVCELGKGGCDDGCIERKYVRIAKAEQRIVLISRCELGDAALAKKLIRVLVQLAFKNPIQALDQIRARVFFTPTPELIIGRIPLIASERRGVMHTVPKCFVRHQLTCARMAAFNFVKWVVFV